MPEGRPLQYPNASTLARCARRHLGASPILSHTCQPLSPWCCHTPCCGPGGGFHTLAGRMMPESGWASATPAAACCTYIMCVCVCLCVCVCVFIYISAAEIGVYDRDTQGLPRVWNREPNDNASNQCPGGCRACEATARKVSKSLGVSPAADYSFPRTRTIQHSCPTARPLPPAPAPAAAAPLIPPSDAAVGPRATAPSLGDDDEVCPRKVSEKENEK